MNALTSMPDTFSAGSTVKYSRSFADYPAADGWALKVHLAGKTKLTVVATVEGGQFQVVMEAAETVALAPGTYRWVERVFRGEEVYDAARGVTTVTIDLETAEDGAAQSWAERTLEIVEARLERRLPKDLESYQIGNRAVVNIPALQLFKIRSVLRAMVAQERNPGRLGPAVHVRFTRPE